MQRALRHRASQNDDMVVRETIKGLQEAGIDFVVTLPESGFLSLANSIVKDKGFQTVPVCNEASGVAICAGAWLAGKKPIMIMSEAALPLAAYTLANVCVREGMPVLMLVGSSDIGDDKWFHTMYRQHTTEPYLDAMGFPYEAVRDVKDIRKTLKEASKTCFAWIKPVAILMKGGLA